MQPESATGSRRTRDASADSPISNNASCRLALRHRIVEQRTSAAVLDRAPDDRLATLMDEAERAEGSLEVGVALYGVLKPALLAAYAQHLATTNPLVDFPTCRILRSIVGEEAEQLAWGREALTELGATPEAAARSRRWSEHLARYLDAAG